MFRKQKQTTFNLLEMVPARNHSWETDDKGLVVVLVPKVRNKHLARLLLPRMKKPYYRLNLDQHGSFIWTRFDGRTPVGEIASIMEERFGRDFDPDYRRISLFIGQLMRSRLITAKNSKEE